MRYTQAEKMEIIRTVEDSDIGIRAMLRELPVHACNVGGLVRHLLGGFPARPPVGRST